MCEKEIEKALEQQMSEREDLITQLNEQDRIMKIMKEQLKKITSEKASSNPPPQKKCVVPILLLCNCPRQGDFFGKNCSICKNVLKNQKCALNSLFRVRQAGVYAKEWNMHIFVGTIF